MRRSVPCPCRPLGRRLAVLAALLVGLAVAPAASAHAILVSATPDNATVVAQAPKAVTLTFSESVETAFGAVRVYDSQARRVDTGKILRPASTQVGSNLEAGLADGTYTVTWRVVSADSHPVHGAFVFSIGTPSGDGQGVAAAVQGAGTPASVGVLRTVFRALGFGLILLVLGGTLLLIWLLPPEAEVRTRLWLAVSWTAALLVPVALAAIVLQGASAGGFGLGHALRGEVIATVLDTRFGKVWLAQAAGAALLAILTQLVPRARWHQAACLGLALWLAVSPGAAGHAQATSAFSFALDAIHVVAASAWIGGLGALVAALALAGAGQRRGLAAAVVPRFSTLALGAVAVLLVAGVTNGYLQVRAWHGLWDTRYGVLLLVKAGLVLGLLLFGALHRLRTVPCLRAATAAGGEAAARAARRFLTLACTELAVAAGVVVVTALLVASPPARSVIAPSGPAAVTAPIGPLQLNLVVDPARSGPNQIHVYLLQANGQPASADEVVLKASLPSAGIGPLDFRGTVAGPGHFVFAGATLPLPGSWSLRVEARQGEFDLYTALVSVRIARAG